MCFLLTQSTISLGRGDIRTDQVLHLPPQRRWPQCDRFTDIPLAFKRVLGVTESLHASAHCILPPSQVKQRGAIQHHRPDCLTNTHLFPGSRRYLGPPSPAPSSPHLCSNSASLTAKTHNLGASVTFQSSPCCYLSDMRIHTLTSLSGHPILSPLYGRKTLEGRKGPSPDPRGTAQAEQGRDPRFFFFF